MENDTNSPLLPVKSSQESSSPLPEAIVTDSLIPSTITGTENQESVILPDLAIQAIEKMGMSLGLKIFLSVMSIGVIGVGGFFSLNAYEKQNNCILGWNKSFDLVTESLPFICTKKESNHCDPITGYMCRGSADKPLILLYPENKQDIQVELEYVPGFSATFPDYDDSKKGWSVTASPDGTLLDHTTQQETYGLFWEGNSTDSEFDLSKGWIVASRDLRNFLYEKLTEIGLNTKEKSDFIMYWYPKLQEYPYVQITFAGEDYNQSAPLKITPKPDSILRVFMVAKPLDTPKKIEPQKLEKFERKGFSVVEWGGTILK